MCAFRVRENVFRSVKITPANSKFRSNDKIFWGAKTPHEVLPIIISLSDVKRADLDAFLSLLYPEYGSGLLFTSLFIET